MKWFVAKLVFRIYNESMPELYQFDEQYRLIKAPNTDIALRKAHNLGDMEQESFTNNKGAIINWMFEDVTDLREIKNEDGITLVHSETKEVTNVNGYLEDLKLRAQRLNSKIAAKPIKTV